MSATSNVLLQAKAQDKEYIGVRRVEPEFQRYDDEIDLVSLIKALLKTWKVWLLAAFLVSFAYFCFQAVSYYQSLISSPYSKIITFTFKGADKGEYPSGATFRIQDIISPAVLQSVYISGELDNTGMPQSEFQNRVSIEPYTPYYREIVAKYDVLLNQKSLTVDQIQSIQTQKSMELNQALSNGVILRFDAKGTEVNPAQIETVLQAIPLEWARQAIADKGVLRTDIQLVSAQTLDESLFRDVDYVVLSDLFSGKIKGLFENIGKVKALEGAATVKDPVTGLTLSDLENKLQDLETYTVDELMSPIRSLGLSRNPRLAAFYYEEKYIMLEEKLALLEDEGQLIKSAYDAYSPNQPMMGVSTDQRSASTNLGYAIAPQLGGEVIDKLLQVAGEDSVEKYRQLLNDRWLTTNLEMAGVKSDMRNTQRLIDAVKGKAADELEQDLRDEYLKRTEAKLPDILSQLRNFYEINWRIYEQISRNRVGSVGYLYKDAHQGILQPPTGFSVKKVLLIYIGLMVLTTVIVVPTVMIRNALKDRARQEQLENG